MKKIKLLTVVLMFLGISVAFVWGRGVQENEVKLEVKLMVVTTTSLIEQIVERVGGLKVDVVNIIPPAQCPGHFDVKPGDIGKLVDADIFFLHGWQGEMFSQQLIATAANPDLRVVQLDIEDNWMTPSVQKAAAEKIADTLIQADSDNSSYYQKLLTTYKESIDSKETEIKAKLEKVNLADTNVLCAEEQIGFVKWIGLTVVAAYGRPDSLTPKVVKELVDKGRAENVSLIIDNIQSGQDAGAGIAEELDCTRIILSNFPGGFEDTETWEKTIDYNIELITEAITR